MPDSPVSQLLRDAERIDATQTRLVLRFARELARVLREVERQLPGLLERAQGTADQVRLAQLAALCQQVRSTLQAAGYDALVRATASSLLADTIASQVLTTSTGKAAAEFVLVQPRIQALQELMRLDWLGEGNKIGHALWKATVRAAIGGTSPSRLAKAIATEIDRSVRQARSLVDTSLSIYARQVEATQATGKADEAFLYAGPADNKVRPFCDQHLGKVYTRASIDKLDNEQIANVFLTGGGFNCRHRWMKVSRFSELQDLADTGQRVPEIAAQLKRVRKAA